MPGTLKILQRFDACEGAAVVVGARTGAPPLCDVGDPALALCAGLGEEERRTGRPVAAVCVRVAGEDDGAWAAPALDWIARHGRRPVLRTPAVIPRDLLAVVRRTGALVALELASTREAVQRALLGPAASPVAGLLLQAQHLEALGIPIVGILGPLLGGLHDDGALRALSSHAAGASLRDLHVVVGQVSARRARVLGEVLGADALRAVARAYGFDPAGPPDDRPARLPTAAHVALHTRAVLAAEGHGIVVDRCGCPLAHREEVTRSPVSLEAPALFETA